MATVAFTVMGQCVLRAPLKRGVSRRLPEVATAELAAKGENWVLHAADDLSKALHWKRLSFDITVPDPIFHWPNLPDEITDLSLKIHIQTFMTLNTQLAPKIGTDNVNAAVVDLLLQKYSKESLCKFVDVKLATRDMESKELVRMIDSIVKGMIDMWRAQGLSIFDVARWMQPVKPSLENSVIAIEFPLALLTKFAGKDHSVIAALFDHFGLDLTKTSRSIGVPNLDKKVVEYQNMELDALASQLKIRKGLRREFDFKKPLTRTFLTLACLNSETRHPTMLLEALRKSYDGYVPKTIAVELWKDLLKQNSRFLAKIRSFFKQLPGKVIQPQATPPSVKAHPGSSQTLKKPSSSVTAGPGSSQTLKKPSSSVKARPGSSQTPIKPSSNAPHVDNENFQPMNPVHASNPPIRRSLLKKMRDWFSTFYAKLQSFFKTWFSKRSKGHEDSI
ncbi:hypothetical protein CCR75_001015 [Bremia lactucae]|uniref:Uncharacterized protein n=1 Tax=Bremia lactucae TaxID=4779 RepID=A0A976NYI0_BRELC|nr:hypothetical protein CCR75_001015 [Bremia lactucae]